MQLLQLARPPPPLPGAGTRVAAECPPQRAERAKGKSKGQARGKSKGGSRLPLWFSAVPGL
ncbi:hypothetical protein GCM10022235_83540 [Kribbella ginsengisoli]|uniref:Uncharacterized protein n=1 Tax=Kribbella ginsengisoli TaxID=363865 RepID=A0ABP6ZB04_9ACTN